MLLRRTAAVAFTTIEGFIDRLVCVLGAVFAAQAPEFFQQYLQRLGGHLDEARRQLAAFEQAALAAGKPLSRFITDTLANSDAGLAQLGATMRETAGRVDTLAAAQAALLNASGWSRPWAFLTHLDAGIAHATAAVFRPAVPTTAEGAVYAVLGMGVAFGLWQVLIRLPLRRALDSKPKANPPIAASAL